MTSPLSHFDDDGAARMVNVGQKPVTHRQAVASGRVRMAAATRNQIQQGELSKGDVLQVARLAGILAAKRTGELIPLCHPLPLDGVQIDFRPSGDSLLLIQAQVHTTGRTGVEMEALTAVSTAALTIYDMVKAIDRGVIIEQIQLEAKSGGKSGDWHRPATPLSSTDLPAT